jgi:hypothetical protein
MTGSRNVPPSGEAVNDIGQSAFIAAGRRGAQVTPWYLLGAEFCPGWARIPKKRRFSSYIKNAQRTLR